MASKRTKSKKPARRTKRTKRQAKRRTKTTPSGRRPTKTSLLDAAAAVLAKAKEPMSCPELVKAVIQAGTWKTRGKTPAATLSAAIHREIRDKGKEARFAKADRGTFRLRAARTGGRQKRA